MPVSMTEEMHCYENAQAERLNGILKQEYGLGGHSGRRLRRGTACRRRLKSVNLFQNLTGQIQYESPCHRVHQYKRFHPLHAPLPRLPRLAPRLQYIVKPLYLPPLDVLLNFLIRRLVAGHFFIGHEKPFCRSYVLWRRFLPHYTTFTLSDGSSNLFLFRIRGLLTSYPANVSATPSPALSDYAACPPAYPLVPALYNSNNS